MGIVSKTGNFVSSLPPVSVRITLGSIMHGAMTDMVIVAETEAAEIMTAIDMETGIAVGTTDEDTIEGTGAAVLEVHAGATTGGVIGGVTIEDGMIIEGEIAGVTTAARGLKKIDAAVGMTMMIDVAVIVTTTRETVAVAEKTAMKIAMKIAMMVETVVTTEKKRKGIVHLAMKAAPAKAEMTNASPANRSVCLPSMPISLPRE